MCYALMQLVCCPCLVVHCIDVAQRQFLKTGEGAVVYKKCQCGSVREQPCKCRYHVYSLFIEGHQIGRFLQIVILQKNVNGPLEWLLSSKCENVKSYGGTSRVIISLKRYLESFEGTSRVIVCLEE